MHKLDVRVLGKFLKHQRFLAPLRPCLFQFKSSPSGSIDYGCRISSLPPLKLVIVYIYKILYEDRYYFRVKVVENDPVSAVPSTTAVSTKSYLFCDFSLL